MRIKLINPNTTLSMTKSIGKAGKKYARKDTEVIAVSPATGPGSIESYYDEYLAIPGVLEENIDAYVIACFGDPGLWAGREVTRKPVIGIAEAAITVSKFLAPNFSIASVLYRSKELSDEAVRMHGASHRCRSIRATGLSVLDGVTPAVKLAEALVDMNCQVCKALTWGFPESKQVKGFSEVLRSFSMKNCCNIITR